MNDKEIKTLVKEKGGGAAEEVYGPYTMGGERIWEVWCYKDDEWHIRFVTLNSHNLAEYQESFAGLAAKIESDHAKGRILPSIMAALGFIVGLGLLVHIVVGEKQLDGQVAALVVSLLASAGAFYYGAWKT